MNTSSESELDLEKAFSARLGAGLARGQSLCQLFRRRPPAGALLMTAKAPARRAAMAQGRRGPGARPDGGAAPPAAAKKASAAAEAAPKAQSHCPLRPDILLTIFPDDKGVESLARQIRVTGRALSSI